MSRNAQPRSFLHLALTFLVTVSLAACSSAPMRSAEPADPEPRASEPPAELEGGLKKVEIPPPERERHIEDARAELATAERIIQQSLPPAGQPPPVGVEPKTPQNDKPQDPKPPPAQQRGCEPACAALASMRRSSEYVCRLAGPGDAKCLDARTRLRNAEVRVTAAQCPCAGPSS